MNSAALKHGPLGFLAALCLVPLVAACGERAGARAEARPPDGRSASNVLYGDFAGSQACADCHPAIFERWSRSPMHQMTRPSKRGVSQAPFDGSQFHFKGDVATMVTEAGEHYMHLESRAYPSAWYRITKVIGGRYREDYAGVQVAAARPDASPASDERILPVSYLLFEKSWRYKGYSVMSPERGALRRGLKWRTSCVFCHNTTPWLANYYDELYGVGAPSYQGAASLKLPSDRRLAYAVTDPDAFERALTDELERMDAEAPEGDDLPSLLEAASEATHEHFTEAHLVEIGVGCEACHGGARAHVANPSGVTPSFLPSAPFLSVRTAAGRRVSEAPAMTHSCAKCHTVLFSRYPYTWEGGERGFDPGGSSMNSGEARDFLLGGCSSALACTNCHDPHGNDDSSKSARLESVEGNSVCTSCHSDYRSSEGLSGHTHHGAASQGSACVACHMPKKNVALDYDLTRYHRIGSPTDRARVEQDRPLECALCHTDKTVRELVTDMERLWPRRYDRDALERLYGPSLDVNAISATLARGKPHEQVVAIHVLGRERRADAVEAIAAQLDHDFPLLRFFARDALERITGKRLALDMHAEGPAIVAQARKGLGLDHAPRPRTEQEPTHATD
ncbi:MAG TPA: cytochrome c3 family protein [Polyangiaceae bacterium]